MPPGTNANMANSRTLRCQDTCSEHWHLHPELGNHTVVTRYLYTRERNKLTINEVLKKCLISNTVLPAKTGIKKNC